MTSVVVIGDIHGNARALRAALAQAQAGPLDHIVFIGDLLTYGHDVEEVLDLVGETQERRDAILLIGNHDQMYFDLADGARQYLDKLPEWIKDSVTLTSQKFEPATLRGRFKWSPEWQLGKALFAHANPFGFRDYRYLNSAEDHAAAVQALAERDLHLGVFGHTHRPLWIPGPITLANAGSVGQPRDAQGSVILRVNLQRDAVTGAFERLAYDVEAHVKELLRTPLPDATKQRLCGFFRQ